MAEDKGLLREYAQRTLYTCRKSVYKSQWNINLKTNKMPIFKEAAFVPRIDYDLVVYKYDSCCLILS